MGAEEKGPEGLEEAQAWVLGGPLLQLHSLGDC